MLSTGQHTLTTQPDNDDSYKHCIYVKLTDSSAKAIEEYLKNKDNTNKKPSILFHKDKGEISFPQSNSNTSEFQLKKFQFALSSVKESNKDTSASFELITYTNNKLKTMGSIEQKLTVQAINDEVFLATKEKVASVAEAEKNNSTIEIKPSGAIVNRTSVSNFNTQNLIRNKQNISAVKPNPPSTTPTLPEKPKSLVTDKTLRERVIHLLAIKPYKKPEIFLKLNKENPLNEKEKESLEQTLLSVATLSAKNNQFDLLNEILASEVKEDWPAYSQNDKQTIKRNIARARQQAANTSLTNTSLNTSLNSSLNTSANRPSSASSFVSSANKQVSAFQPPPSNKISPTKMEHKQFHNGFNSSNNKTKFSLSPGSDLAIENFDISNKKPAENEFESSNKRAKLGTNGVAANKPIESFKPDLTNDIYKKYRPIQNNQQYKEYKDMFDNNYKEYKDLYNYLLPVSTQFEIYRQEIEAISDHASKEYSEKKQKIFQEFQAKKADPEFCKKQERCDYLDKKLSHLNNLLEKYVNSVSQAQNY